MRCASGWVPARPAPEEGLGLPRVRSRRSRVPGSSPLPAGVPADEDNLLDKLFQVVLLSEQTVATLRRMKGFRNILVHEYTAVDDRIVYEVVTQEIGDLGRFAAEVRAILARA